ncbi:hypothetical protein [Paenibacillus tengchongensis]|uniref:hypothetical protein n=1 Tax=Paenibacillus tengchongensis TaxID=2608684 RepID=UPI00124F52D9|nr:hypothetical protein [Paenibacillus tengchongensis]
MIFIGGVITALCLLLLFIFALRAEEKLKVLCLVSAFLFALNAIVLLYRYLPTMQEATEVSYLYLFSLNADQLILFFRSSLLISLVSFTVYAYQAYYK